MFKSKSAPETKPVFLVVHRSPSTPGFEETATREQALEAFRQIVALGHHDPRSRRRLLVTGPDYCVQPEDLNDPLLIGEVAVKAVLTEREYEAIVLGPVAEAVLAG